MFDFGTMPIMWLARRNAKHVIQMPGRVNSASWSETASGERKHRAATRLAASHAGLTSRTSSRSTGELDGQEGNSDDGRAIYLFDRSSQTTPARFYPATPASRIKVVAELYAAGPFHRNGMTAARLLRLG